MPIFVVDDQQQYVVDNDGRFIVLRSPQNPTALIDPATLDQYDDTRYTIEIVSPTGQLIADITQITPAFQYTTRRNRAEDMQFSVDLGAATDLAKTLGMRLWELFAGYINEVRIRRGNRYLMGGQLIYAEPSLSADRRTLAVRATGFLDLFSSRYLLPSTSNGGATHFSSTDIGAVIWSMIQTSQGLSNGDFGVTLGAIQTSRPITEDWQPFASSLSDIFQSQTERVDSVDFAFSYDKKLYVYYPGIGTDKTELLMSYPGNITGITLPRDWTRTVNYSINRGSGNGTDVTPIETRQDTASQSAYRIRMRIDDYPDVSVPATLDNYGDEALRLNGAGQTIPKVTLDGRLDPQLGAYWIGDRVRFAVDDPSFDLLDDRSWRINEIAVSVNENHAETITLQVGYN